MTVVIFAENDDVPVDAVVRELTERDVPVFRADTSWFPRTLTMEARLGGDGRWRGLLRTPHRSVDLSDIRSIWYRHPGAFSFPQGMTDVERAYAHREARLGLGGVLTGLDTLWVNHPNRSADAAYKPLQLAIAARCGLTTAATVITNSADAVRRFASASPTGVVHKSLGPNSVTEGSALTVAFTHRLEPSDLGDLSGIETTATQVQQWVNKIYEARVVVIGERLFTILIRAGSEASRVDWRADYPALSYEWIDTPHDIEKGLRDYMARMGLTYAAVDFAIDADERWIFLESNSAGQYFWLEANTGAPITTALVDALSEGVRP
ncbi:MAG: ATP-grasp ribosomal peptide maturase [Pseudonocardiales bacterium]|nr:ATP-grasp ribosomal peptide maturase [Pseudonocardiales bacterium]